MWFEVERASMPAVEGCVRCAPRLIEEAACQPETRHQEDIGSRGPPTGYVVVIRRISGLRSPGAWPIGCRRR